MGFIEIITQLPILIITVAFLGFVISVSTTYARTNKNLKSVYEFLRNLERKEISYRFNQLDEFMDSNPYTTTSWQDFKKALIFPEKLFAAAQNSKLPSDFSPEIYLTVDASYFFNEESLIYTNINHKFIQTMPTLVTGLGPFFTFLKMAIAFSQVDFGSGDVDACLNALMHNIQIAALCSVFAVGYSLAFILIEKILYGKMCKKYYLLIQKEFIRLFDVCTSEQFLLDLVKESKLQNLTNEKILKALPEDFAKTLTKSLGELTVPYLENIIYSLNKLNETMDKNGGGDAVDKLF